MLGAESLQPFNKPSETVKMLNDVGNSNFKLMYDTATSRPAA